MATEMKRAFCLLSLLLIMYTAFGQQWKNWNSASVNLAFSKKIELSVSHLRSYSIFDSYSNGFNQTSVSLDYDFTKRFSAKAGYSLTKFPADNVSAPKYSLRSTYKFPVGKAINWANSIQGELHSATTKNYNYRIIYITRFSPKHRMEFLKLSPSVSYWLFYNIGGKSIQYFDESGSPLAKDTPDGLHRGRFLLNLNSKINNNLSLSLYYLNQHEFNLIGNDLNVTNPRNGKIVRPFSNYQVAGISLSLSFDLYKKSNN